MRSQLVRFLRKCRVRNGWYSCLSPKKVFFGPSWELFLLVGLSFLLVSACDHDPNQTKLQYMPDMADTPTVKAQEDYLDPPDYSVHTQAILYPKDMATAEKDLANQIRSHPKVIEKGKVLYGTFCAVCHGLNGKGEGTLSNAYVAPVPDITRAEMRSRADGFYFLKITKGGPMMPSYGHAIDPEERWQIIHYLRTLQKN